MVLSSLWGIAVSEAFFGFVLGVPVKGLGSLYDTAYCCFIQWTLSFRKIRIAVPKGTAILIGRSDTARTCGILLPKTFELLVSTAFASFLMRSNYFQTLFWPPVPTVSVYSVRQSGINCGQKRIPHETKVSRGPRVLPRNDEFHLGGAFPSVC